MRAVIALVIVAALGAGAGWAAWDNEQLDEPGLTQVSTARVVTPVMSMRRVPHALLQPQRDTAVQAAVASIPSRQPGQSCLFVSESGRELVASSPDDQLVPASTQKLLVGAAILDILGPDSTFNTELRAASPVAEGVIAGDVWLVGGGDPLLSTEAYRARNGDRPRRYTNLEDLADAVVSAGVQRIEGRLIGDGTRYDSVYDVPSWPARYREQVSAGPLAGLTANGGLATFTPELVAINPGTPAADPPAHAAGLLTALLEERGVEVVGEPASGPAPAEAQVVASLPSLPLVDIVTEMMQWSDNTVAELFMKELGYQTTGEGSTVAGRSALVAALAAMGTPVEGVAPVDGSGLDLNNAVTCRALAAALDQTGPTSPLAQTLATAGRTGTLRSRLLDTAVAGRVHAKTGSLRHVMSLAGFAESSDGETYTFAIISNVADGVFIPDSAEATQDELMTALVTLPPAVVTPELEPLDPLVR